MVSWIGICTFRGWYKRIFFFGSGNEIGMLEDMCVAVAELGNVHFQVKKKG